MSDKDTPVSSEVVYYDTTPMGLLMHDLKQVLKCTGENHTRRAMLRCISLVGTLLKSEDET